METIECIDTKTSIPKSNYPKSKSSGSDEPRNLIKLTKLNVNKMKFQNKSEDKTQNSLKKSENNDTTFIKRKYSNNEIKSALLSTVISSIGEDTTDASSSNLNPSCNSSPVIGALDFEPSTQTKKTSEVVEPFVKQTQTKRKKNRHNVYFSKASYLVGPSMSQLPSINF